MTIPKALQNPARLTVNMILAIGVVACIVYLIRHPVPWGDAFVSDFQAKEKAALRDYVRVGHWFAAVFSLGVFILLALTQQFWIKPWEAAKKARGLTPPWRRWLQFLPALLIVLVLAGIIRWPRLTIGYYSDEIYTLRKFIHGDYWQAPLEPREFKTVDWDQTLWGYSRPNNHTFFTIVARGFLETWRTATGRDREALNSVALRLPSFLAGLLSIALAAAFLSRLGCTRAGLIAALLLAIHPWHVVHSVSVRGYAFVFFFATGTLFLASEAMRDARWRNWILFALCQTLLLYTNPGLLFFAGLLNLAVLGVLGYRRSRHEEHPPAIARLLVANAVSAVALSPFIFTAYPQLRVYLERYAPRGGAIGGAWVTDVLSLLASGMPWQGWNEENPFSIGLRDVLARHPILSAFTFTFLGLSLILGLIVLFARRRPEALVVLPFLVAPVLGYLHALSSGAFLFKWYFVYALPGLVILCAVGLEQIGHYAILVARRSKLAAIPRVAYILPLLPLLGFLIVTHPQRHIVRTYPKEPILTIHRELQMIAAHRKRLHRPAPLIAAFWKSLQIYNPEAQSVTTAEELETMIAHSEETGRELFVAFGYLPAPGDRRTDVYDVVLDPDRFDLIRKYYGLEADNSDYYLYRLRQPEQEEKTEAPVNLLPLSNGIRQSTSPNQATAGGGSRTHTPGEGNWILSPARLPIPPRRLCCFLQADRRSRQPMRNITSKADPVTHSCAQRHSHPERTENMRREKHQMRRL